MKKILVVLLLAVFILTIACDQKNSATGAYAGYQGQGAQPQPQYVGGGCGVAPAGNYADNPAGSFEKSIAA